MKIFLIIFARSNFKKLIINLINFNKMKNFKNSVITLAMLVLSCTAFGQQIKKKNVELDDLVSLLGAAGYELFSYDISEMLDERYDVAIVKKEFSAGKEIGSSILVMVPNKYLLTDFPESDRQKIMDDGRIIDSKTQALFHAEKIIFGLYPSGNDSTKFMQVNIPDFVRSKTPFKLRGLATKDSDKMVFFYNTRPFKIKAFREDEFIPLILFGSAWYDERFNTFRFCGEREIDPDMSSEILKDIPHHYIIGVKFVKKQQQ